MSATEAAEAREDATHENPSHCPYSGDGIGSAVIDAAWTLAQRVGALEGVALDAVRLPWSCAYYKQTGRMIPADGIETLRGFDAILPGAVGPLRSGGFDILCVRENTEGA